MEANLLGYALNALDAAERQEIEVTLAADPKLAADAELLRSSLEPLNFDREATELPPGLVMLAVGRVAEYICTRPEVAKDPSLPKIPALPKAPKTLPAPPIPIWRRADVMVLACMLLLVCGLLLAAIPIVSQRWQIQACQQQLQELSRALMIYAEMHGEQFPQITREPPSNRAGDFIRQLVEAGLLQSGAIPHCASDLWAADVQIGMKPTTYAYSLGYVNEEGELIGPRRDEIFSGYPIAADRPTFYPSLSSEPTFAHGIGFNVLHADGVVRYSTSIKIGPGGDDIFRNTDGLVHAGIRETDVVLGGPDDGPEG